MWSWIKNIRIMYSGASNTVCSMNGTIFDIREFTVHDGPGPRITVFLKGCPLRCRWCHNPEGLSTARQLMYKKNFCTHCGACMKKCPYSLNIPELLVKNYEDYKRILAGEITV